jgi:hypothetical protein
MKTLLFNLLFFFIFLFFVGCTRKIEYSDSNFHGLRGNVKTVRLTSYKGVEKFGEIERFDVPDKNKILTRYNKEGLVTEIETYFKWDKYWNRLKAREKTDLDENGKLIGSKKFDAKGELELKKEYQVDENGFPIRISTYQVEGELVRVVKQKFNSEGNNIERIEYRSNGELDFKRVFTYDLRGSKVGVEYLNKEGESARGVFKNDKEGNPIELNYIDKSGLVLFEIRYEYEYDSKGNWIKKNEFENHTINFIIEREIDYY